MICHTSQSRPKFKQTNTVAGLSPLQSNFTTKFFLHVDYLSSIYVKSPPACPIHLLIFVSFIVFLCYYCFNLSSRNFSNIAVYGSGKIFISLFFNPRRHADFTKIVLTFIFPILLVVRLLY